MGPDCAALWAVLRGDEAACRYAVVDWLKVASDPRLLTDQVAWTFTTLEDQVSLAFRTLGLEQPKGISDSPGFLYTYELPPQPKEDSERYYRPELASQVRVTSTPWFERESVAAFLAKDERVALSTDVRAAFVRLAAASPIASAIRSYAGPFPHAVGGCLARCRGRGICLTHIGRAARRTDPRNGLSGGCAAAAVAGHLQGMENRRGPDGICSGRLTSQNQMRQRAGRCCRASSSAPFLTQAPERSLMPR
jgi:hypothetical protein